MADSAAPRASTARRVVALFRPHRGRVALVVIAIVLGSGLGVANPLLVRYLFDHGLYCGGCPHLPLVVTVVCVMAGLSLLIGVIGVAQAYLTNMVGQRVMLDLRDVLYAHLQTMSLRFFTGTRTGETQSRIANDVGGVETVVTETASKVVANSVVVISTIIAMLVLNWQLSTVSLLVIPLFAWLSYHVGGRRRRVAAATQRAKAEISAITEETLSVSGVLLAKVFGRQRDEVERFRRESRSLARLQLHQQMLSQGFSSGVHALFAVTPAIIYLIAGVVIARSGNAALSVGTLVAFTALQTRLFFPVSQMFEVSVEARSSMALFQRVFEYLDMSQEIVDGPDARVIDPRTAPGHLRFHEVSFSYARDGDGAAGGARRWAVDGVSLEIDAGQLAAVVGPSGAGKTTLSYLIPRLYDVDRGRIELDGVDVREITLDSLARHVGMVTQETYLFHASVRWNLQYARPGAGDDELQRAARAANIHDRIMALENGYDTVVGERGYRMSGGERQRLAIARAILKDPRLLILDEATSALDTASERVVQSALLPLMRGRTTIAIAHRLSTILSADVIFVMDGGRVVERGTHADLVGTGGLYAMLYHEQFSDGLIEARCSDGVVLASGRVAPAGIPH